MSGDASVQRAEQRVGKKLLFVGGLLAFLFAGAPLCAEHIVVSGGPALMQHENYRLSGERHDRWWANFVRAATVRFQKLAGEGKKGGVTWMVYKKGYECRGGEDGRPYVKNIEELAKKYGVKLVWLHSKDQFFATLNQFAGGKNKIESFDYFGHSNRHAFMLDYSCGILGGSEVWIHETELKRLRRSAFAAGAKCVSYGCFTGESMSKHWQAYTGVALRSSSGKTDYYPVTSGELPVPSSGGVWCE